MRRGKKGGTERSDQISVVPTRGRSFRHKGMATAASLWPLEPNVLAAITNPEIIIGTMGYLFLKPILRNSGLVDKRKGAYKTSMILYNVLMAVFSLACFIATTVALGWDRGYGKPLLDWAGDTPSELYTNSCPSPVYNSKLFTYAAWAFYYSKYVEYLDTAWLVLKGKEVSFLQTFHHFGAPWDVYLGIKFANEGLWIFVFLNAFIHTVMYTYYAITAAGVPYPAKPLITLMQICQFLAGFTVVYPYKNIPCFRANQGMMISWIFNYAYVGGVLALFMHFFYMDNFGGKKKDSGGKGKEAVKAKGQ